MKEVHVAVFRSHFSTPPSFWGVILPHRLLHLSIFIVIYHCLCLFVANRSLLLYFVCHPPKSIQIVLFQVRIQNF